MKEPLELTGRKDAFRALEGMNQSLHQPNINARNDLVYRVIMRIALSLRNSLKTLALTKHHAMM